MTLEKTPGWLRGFEALFGLIGIILAGATYILLDQYVQYLLSSSAIILFGLLWLLRTFTQKDVPSWLRGMATIFGIILLILAIMTPFIYISYNGWMLAAALILEGLGWIFWMLARPSSGAFKWLGLLLGLVQLIVAAMVFAIPAYTMWLIAGAIIISSLILLFKGLAGK